MTCNYTGELVLCPSCGNIQNLGEPCMKCGAIIAIPVAEAQPSAEETPPQPKTRTKVSLIDRRKAKGSKTGHTRITRRTSKQPTRHKEEKSS